ncbi:MAG: hypothetical protein Tsb009_24670 [Planctomycetaceae bacterium]
MTDEFFSERQLIDYLDEMLPAETMSRVETALRNSESLRHQLAAVSRKRDRGEHSVGEIWRRARLSCPTRNELGSYLLETLDPPQREYIEFHLKTIGCQICSANLDDLRESVSPEAEIETRRRKFFQTSAGYLPKS